MEDPKETRETPGATSENGKPEVVQNEAAKDQVKNTEIGEQDLNEGVAKVNGQHEKADEGGEEGSGSGSGSSGEESGKGGDEKKDEGEVKEESAEESGSGSDRSKSGSGLLKKRSRVSVSGESSRTHSKSSATHSSSNDGKKRRFKRKRRKPNRRRSSSGSSSSGSSSSSSSRSASPRNRDRKRKRRRGSPSSSPSVGSQRDSTIYIANLRRDISDRYLRKKFKKFGAIANSEIVSDPFSHESRGFGFITYETGKAAQKAIDKMNGKEVKGRNLRVELSRRGKPRRKTPGKYMGKSNRRERDFNFRRSNSRDRFEKRRFRRRRSESRS